MLKTIQAYVVMGLLALSVTAGGASYILWKSNQAMKADLAEKQASLEKTQKNLVLVSDQLAHERETRKAVEESMAALKEVPDVDYSTPLPQSIRSVLSGFHKRMQ